jgi:hypothetical protein
MRKRLLQLTLGLAIIGAATLAVIRYVTDIAVLEITNDAAEAIKDVHVVVWEYQFDLGDIKPGEIRKIKIRDYADSSWSVQGLWSSGEHFSGSHGYITHGMSFSDRLVFSRNRTITFTQKE